MHPRNRHQGHYEFEQLMKSCPELSKFVSMNPYQKLSINFADPEAVKVLNRALLMHFYGIVKWEIPASYLCPPIPGRADYVHHLADLLSASNGGRIPQGDSIQVLDIGVGANCIYPLIGHCEYGWSFVGADVDSAALASANKIVQANRKLAGVIELRKQNSSSKIFQGLIQEDEVFDFSMCNPPFHASLEEARQGSQRKWRNLGLHPSSGTRKGRAPLLNFGGQGAELWCPGGEAAFICRMIEESREFSENVFWFSTLVSKDSSLPRVQSALKKAGVMESRTVEMAQGNKKSRFVAWTFLTQKRQKEWRMSRWNKQ